jgi:cytochrome c553
MEGSWIEYAGEFLADAPALGVRKKEGKREIQAAVPGMIMTLDQSAFPHSSKTKTAFHRLFAPAEPHTTSAKGRSCTSCHATPLALGYGRGELDFNLKTGQWTFESTYEYLQDGLPADAWTGFLEEPDANMYSTRQDFKPFSLEEQQNILAVGACLTCHKDDSKVMLNSLSIPFSEYKKKMSSRCVEAYFE